MTLIAETALTSMFFTWPKFICIQTLLIFQLFTELETKKATLAPGVWSKWGPWKECSKTCGIGVRRRIRVCSYTGTRKERRCKGNIGGQMKNCDTKIACPIDGGWSTWVAWKCTVTCGGGDGEQKRSCTNPKPMFGGKECVGPAEEKGKCNMQKCPDQVFTLSPLTARAIKQSVENENHNFEKNQDEVVRIPCSKTVINKIYEEYPKSSLRWTKNGQILKVDHDRMYLTPTELTIKKLNFSDNGVYVCSVQYASQVMKPISFATLSVTSSSPNVKVREDENMELVCYGMQLKKLFKNSTQKLFFDGKEYSNLTAKSSTKSIAYEIKEVKKNMAGKWLCKTTDPLTNREWTTGAIVVKVLPAIPKFLRFLSNRKVLLTIGVIFLVLIMLLGILISYVIIKTREEFMKEYEKWCQIVKWEELKAGGVPKWVLVDEEDLEIDEEGESEEEI